MGQQCVHAAQAAKSILDYCRSIAASRLMKEIPPLCLGLVRHIYSVLSRSGLPCSEHVASILIGTELYFLIAVYTVLGLDLGSTQC